MWIWSLLSDNQSITEITTIGTHGGSIYSGDTMDKGIIHILGSWEIEGKKFHHATQNGRQFKMYELLISKIFHLVFWDHG